MQDVLAVTADLQRQVLEDAALSQVPFSHIPADELILPLPQSDVQSDTPALENGRSSRPPLSEPPRAPNRNIRLTTKLRRRGPRRLAP